MRDGAAGLESWQVSYELHACIMSGHYELSFGVSIYRLPCPLDLYQSLCFHPHAMLSLGGPSTSSYESHTFEYKSSLAPKPPPVGFADGCCGGLEAAGVSGAALFHPPKSSSAAIFGSSLILVPPAGFDMFIELPHDEKSFVVVMAGDLLSVFGFELADDSGVAQALFEPHGSSFANPENALELTGATGADFVAGCGTGAGAERLKTEWRLEDGGGAFEAVVDCEGKGSE